MSGTTIRVNSRDENDHSDDFVDTERAGEMTLEVDHQGTPGPYGWITLEGRIHTFWLHDLYVALAVEHQGGREAP